MEALLIYFGKMILSSGLMFGYYQLLLKDKTFHHYNRFYLLGTLLVSLLLPLLKVSYFTLPLNSDLYLLLSKLQPISKGSPSDRSAVPAIFTGIIALVSVLLTSRFVYGIYKIVKLKSRFPQEKFEGLNFYQTDLASAPFSYFRNLFWKNNIPLHSDLGKQIMKHEMAHIEQKHTYDKIMIETIRAIFWFNPFFHLIKKEVYLIHEYLADHKAIKKSDTKAFAQMLLASHFSGNTLAAASPLLNAHLKKRLKMIQTSKTKFSYARKMLALPLLFTIAFACVVHAQNSEIKAANNEIARAVNQIKNTGTTSTITTTTTTTETDTFTNTDEGNGNAMESLQSVHTLKQSELKIGELEQQIRQIEETLETIDPGSEEASVKFGQIAALSEKIGELVHAEDFGKAARAIHERTIAALGEGELERMTEKLTSSIEAEALEMANIAVRDAVAAKAEAKLMQEAAARARAEGAAAVEEARIAIKEAALAREEALIMQKEAAEARVAAAIARKQAEKARREAGRRKELELNR